MAVPHFSVTGAQASNKHVLNSCGMTVSTLGQEQESEKNKNPEILVADL